MYLYSCIDCSFDIKNFGFAHVFKVKDWVTN